MPEEVASSSTLDLPRVQPPATTRRRPLFYVLLGVYFVWMAALTVMWLTTVHRAAPLPPREPPTQNLTLHVDKDGNLVLPPGIAAPTTQP